MKRFQLFYYTVKFKHIRSRRSGSRLLHREPAASRLTGLGFSRERPGFASASGFFSPLSRVTHTQLQDTYGCLLWAKPRPQGRDARGEVSKTRSLGLAGLDSAGGRRPRSQKSQPLLSSFSRSVLSDSLTPRTSPPGSSVHGTSQVRALRQAATSLSGGSSRPRDRNGVSCVS